MKNYEFLCEYSSGSINIVRFYSTDLFNSFCNKHIRVKNSSSKNKLKYAFLRSEDGHEEDVLLLNDTYPELHFHAGIANFNIVKNAIEELEDQACEDEKAILLSKWEKTFSQLKGVKAIQYMLNLKSTDFARVKDFDQEGHEYIKPIRVVFAGPANAGKSTLFNYILGKQHALVSSVAGTTRDVLKASVQLAGFEVILYDCAGLLREEEIHNDIDRKSQDISLEIMHKADVVVAFSHDLKKMYDFKAKQLLIQAKSDEYNDVAKVDCLLSVHKKEGIDEFLGLLEDKCRSLKGKVISDQFIKTNH